MRSRSVPANQARPAAAWRSVSTGLTRRRPAVAALGLALVLLTATAFVTVTWLWQTAVAREELAVQVLDRYLEAAEARLNVPAALSEEERSRLLEAVTLYEGMLDQRGRRVGTPVQIARANIRVAKVLRALGEPDRAIDVLTSTEALLRREMERNPNDLEPAGELLICQHRKLVAFWFSRRPHDQMALATKLHADAETVALRWPNRKEYLAIIALARRTYGQFLLDAGDLKRAEPILRQALQDETELQAASPHDPMRLVCLASAQASLANLAFLKGQWEEFIDFNLNRLAIAERIAEVSHPAELLSAMLGYRDAYRLLRKLGRHDEAKLFFNRWSALTRKLAEKFSAIPDYRRQVGVCLFERAFDELQQEDAGADETFREYRDLLEALVRDFPNDEETRGGFALFLATSPCSQLRDLSKAKEQAEECLRHSPELVSARVALGVLACHEGSWDDAEAILSPLASVTRLNEPPIPLCASPYFVEVLCRKGRFGEADQFLKSLHDPKYAAVTFGSEASYFDAASRRIFAKYAKADSDQAP